MVAGPNITKEAAIPDWGGRLVLQLQSAFGSFANAITNGTVAFANAWATPRTLSFTGDVTGSHAVDGSANVATALTLTTAQPAVHTWALAQTFTTAPVFTDGPGSRTAIGLPLGTSGATVPLLSTANTWTLTQTFTLAPVAPAYKVSTLQVVGARQTGWGAASSTLSRAAYASYAGHTYGVSYVQATAQATDNAVELVSQTLAALITDLTAHGLIGA
jgi:hypothetical protein